jgi:hypothetical protein
MQTDTTKCIAAKNFLQISEENMALLLTQDILNVENELVLVNAAERWAQHEAQRRGLTGDDAGVRAVLKPRLLSLLRLLTLTPEQFLSGPSKKQWLTINEKWAVTTCRNDKVTTMLPKHLSTSFQLRNCSLLNYNRIFIAAKPLTKSGIYFCHTCNSPKGGCYLNAIGVFRVTENCKLLGFVLPSRCKVDPTVLSPKKHYYDEHIIIRVCSCGTSLSTTDCICVELYTMVYKKVTLYNATISIIFDCPIQLTSDKWFLINCYFIHPEQYDSYTKLIREYPNAELANRGYSNGIEFIFYTEELRGYHKSVNDGLFQSLLLSPS